MTRPILGSYEKFHTKRWLPWWTNLIFAALFGFVALTQFLDADRQTAIPYLAATLLWLSAAYDEWTIRSLARELDRRRGLFR